MINNKIKKGVTIGGTFLLLGCSSDYETPKTKITQAKNPIELSMQLRELSDIEWILDKENKNYKYGKQPEGKETITLEDAINTHNPKIDPEIKDEGLNEWLNPTLARLVPLKDMIEKHANHYEINPLWAAMFFSFESQLNPSDYNTFSDDFGMGQIKRQSERIAKTLGTIPDSIFYSPYLNPEKSIYDPETNIIMSLMLHRYNIARYGLQNSDQTYAVYVRGTAGLDEKGELNHWTIDLLDGFHSRYDVMKKVVPLFELPTEDIKEIDNKDTREILQVYHKDATPEDKYQMMLDHFIGTLIRKTDGSAKSVLTFDDCVVFARTLDKSYGRDQTNNYRALESLGDSIYDQVESRDLKKRMKRSLKILDYSME